MLSALTEHKGKVVSAVLVLVATSAMIFMSNVMKSAADGYIKNLVIADIANVKRSIDTNQRTLGLLNQKAGNVDESLKELREQQKETDRDIKQILHLMINRQGG